MLNGITVPLPRREVDTGRLRVIVSARVPAPRTVESNAHVAAAAYLMKHADVTALAVVDGREPEQSVGVITAADVARVIADGGNVNDVRIYQLMSPNQADADHMWLFPSTCWSPEAQGTITPVNELEEGTGLSLDFGKLASVAAGGAHVVPAVLQDADSGEVLFIGYVNEEALYTSQHEKIAVLWSTSRNELWRKGATSGDVLELAEIRVNCEQNSLLYLVRRTTGGACHTLSDSGSARPSCYYRTITDELTLKPGTGGALRVSIPAAAVRRGDDTARST